MTNAEKNYYSAMIVFENNSPAPDYDTLYEERIILLQASSDDEAESKVMQYAEDSKHRYQNCYGETITITAKQVIEVQGSLYETVELDKGTEIYSRHFRDYEAYEAFDPLLKGKQL